MELIDQFRTFLTENPVGFLILFGAWLATFNVSIVALTLALRREKPPALAPSFRREIESMRAEIERLSTTFAQGIDRSNREIQEVRHELTRECKKRYALARQLSRRGYDLHRISEETGLSFGEVRMIVDLERLDGRSLPA